MMKYICTICGYIYDEDKENVSFQDLANDWVCPLCKAPKTLFKAQQSKEKQTNIRVPQHLDEDWQELSAMQLSALFSNLARGLEKQYQDEASALFHELADYYMALTPPVQDGQITKLIELLLDDLNQGYPGLKQMAKQEQDRGTQRICVWGEKVTMIINSLLERYLHEGPDFLSHRRVWVCSICGFIYIGDQPPQLCPVCKVPDWKFEEIEWRDDS